MKKKILSGITIAILSLSIPFGASIANQPVRIVQEYKGTEYVSLLKGMTVEEYDMEMKIRSDREELFTWFKGNIDKDHFGGHYFENEQLIFLITYDADQGAILKELQKKSSYPDGIELRQVKYSYAELKKALEGIPEGLDIIGKGIDPQRNKITVISSSENFEKNKLVILKYVSADMVDWIEGSFTIIDQ